MSLYPSLEDMKVDQLMKAQIELESKYNPSAPMYSPSAPAPSTTTMYTPSAPVSTSPQHSGYSGALYPSLAPYMGIEFSEQEIAQNIPEYAVVTRQNMPVATPTQSGPLGGMVAPITGNSVALQKAFVTNGIRQLSLCKDAAGLVGLRVCTVDNGVFVCYVTQGSPAAKGGLRFGDQILEINGTSLAGFSMKQVHKIINNAPVNNIKFSVRDRPLERTVTLNKDSTGHIGFHFKDGRIVALVKDTSATRNGVLTNQQILEVNGMNVVGMKDKHIVAEIAKAPMTVTVTIIPSYIYEHMMKKMNPSLLKSMDHSPCM